MWTDEMEKSLVRLWNDEGLSAINCARELNKTYPGTTVFTKGSVLGKKARMEDQGTVFTERVVRTRKRPAKVVGPDAKVTGDIRCVSVPVVIPSDGADAETKATPVLFTEATNNQCKWIDGDPKQPNLTVCGKPTKEGSSYCEHHHRIVYIPPEQSRKLIKRTINSR